MFFYDKIEEIKEERGFTMRIITVGREFGSGGREFGKRLAELLGYDYYDKEIITKMAKESSASEDYIEEVLEKRPIPYFPITIGRSFYPMENPMYERSQEIYELQEKIILDLSEKSDCVIVGRCADYILRDKKPLRLFIYADMVAKIDRCKRKGPEEEDLLTKDLKRKIKSIDKDRSRYYEFYTGQGWGDPLSYDMMINTTYKNIKELVEDFSKMIKE